VTAHVRTAIRRLSIRGYRSIRSVDLDDIPDVVVLHGPNGAGKSNLLLAVQLVLRAAAAPEPYFGSKNARTLSLEQADRLLGLRPEDFHHGGRPEIRIAIDVVLGTKAADLLRVPSGPSPGRLSLEIVFNLSAETVIGYRSERWEMTLGEVSEIDGPVQSRLLPRLVQVSPAYRVPGTPSDPEKDLFRKCLSADPLEREAVRRLGRRLATARLFGAGAEPIAIVPISDERYNEQRIFLAHPDHGDLPLRNLGSGEQQLVYMLAQQVITPAPVAHIEEPEAHLHTTLMEPFARILHESVAGDPPDVDQLWIATHHHHFALALQYFDVKLAGGAAEVTPKPRAKAAPHFWEPGPIWEALRQLASSAKTRAAVVFRNAEGDEVTAGDILDSIEVDPEQRVATEYARAMTEAMVLAMRQRAETQK
jgi:ABC-type transport system involved in cytochrome c biogenesis ATPase subunit